MPTPEKRRHRAIYTGSFDPPTLGHVDIIERGRHVFDDLIVAIGRNVSKKALFTLEQRKELMQGLVDDICRKHPSAGQVRVETYEGLTVDFAKEVGAPFILRGIRNISDLTYECQLAMTNRQVADLETIFIMTSQAYSYTSSSLIKQIAALGGDIDSLKPIVPNSVIRALKQLKKRTGLTQLIDDGTDS